MNDAEATMESMIGALPYLATVIAVSARLGHRASGRPGLVIGAHLAAGTAFCLFAIKLASASF